MLRRLCKLLYVVGALAVLAGAAWAVLNSLWLERLVEHRVVARLERLTGGRIEVEGFRLRPFISQVSLRRLVLHGKRLAAESPLFAARNVVVRVDLLSLLRRKLLLRSFEWEEAGIHLYTRPDGSTNFPEPKPPFQAGEVLQDLVNVSAGRVTLARTQIVWNQQRLPLELGADEVAVQLTFHPSGRYSGKISTSEATVKADRWSLPPTTLTARLEFSSRDVAVTSLAWESAGLRGRGAFRFRNPSSPEGEGSFRAEGAITEIARSVGLQEIQAGTVKWDGEASYGKGALQARGRLEARQVVISTAPLRLERIDLTTDYSVDPQRVSFSNLSISALGGVARGHGEISLIAPAPISRFRTEIQGVDLAALLQALSSPRKDAGRIRFASKIQGTAETWWRGRFQDAQSRFDLRLQARPGDPPAGYPVDGVLRGSATKGRALVMQIHEAQFNMPHSTLRAQGALGLERTSLSMEFVTSDIQEWRPVVELIVPAAGEVPLTLRSPLSFSGAIRGPLRRPEIQGEVGAGSFAYRDWTWDALRVNLFVTSDRLEVSSGYLRRGKSTISVAGSAALENWELARDGSVRLSARLQQTPLEDLKAALGRTEEISGVATGALDLEGTVTALSGAGALRIEQGSYHGEPFDSLAANLRVSQSVWAAEDIRLRKGRGQITGDARVDLARRSFAVELQGENVALASMKRLPLPRRADASSPVDGTLSFDVRGGGTPDDVRLVAKWGVADLQVMGTRIGDLRGSAEWQGPRMRLEGEVLGSGATLRYVGEASTQGDWELDLSGSYTALRVEPWARLILGEKFKGHVLASGAFSARGPLKNPPRLQVQTQTQDLVASFTGLSLKNETPVELRYADQTLTASRFRMRGPSTDLEVEASVGFKDAARMLVIVQGKADATLMSLLDPELQATGNSELTLRMTGDPQRPLLNGVINVRDVNLGYGDLPFRMTGLRGEIALEGERATIRSLRGASGGGTVVLTGYATFTEIPRFDVRLELDEVRMQYPRDFTSVLDGTLRLVGTSDRGQVSGELAVRQLFTGEHLRLLARVGEAGAPGSEEPPGVASPLASRVRLNIAVRSAPSVRLETRDLRLVADIDLRIQGTLARPVEVGTIHILSGEAVFRGNRYRLNRGDISMTNPFRTQRLLNLEAQTRVQRYDLTIALSGPPDRLKVSYRSDPPLSAADILSLLAFGYARQQEEMSTTGAQPLRTVGASALLSEALSSQVSGRIQRLFGVSRIKIDPNVGGVAAATGGARVTVEQQVTRDLTLTYVTTTASSQQRLIQFEWVINEKVALVGARDHNGIFSMELKFRQRFK